MPGHRRGARIMIATIKAEWRKNRFRPAFLVSSGLIAGITVLIYGLSWYQALHPGTGERRGVVSILTLYPDQFVNNVMGAGFPLGAAIALVLCALIACSEHSWRTTKTTLTHGPRRLPLDRKPVRQAEPHGFDAELSFGCVRPVRRAVNRCGAGRGGPLRLLRRARDNRGRFDPAEGRHISLFLPRQPLRGRPWSWITGRPRLTDGLVVAFNLLFGTGALIASYVHARFALFGVVLLLVETLPLWWRRRFPVAVLAVVLCAEIARWALQLSNEPSGPALVFAVD